MSSNLAFDDSRIKNHADKLLLSHINSYFVAFATGDFNRMNEMEAEDFHMPDIPLGIVKTPKRAWFEANQGFSTLMSDVQVQAISLHGSSAPGFFAIMENVVWFTLKVDPPEDAKRNLPHE